MTKGRLEAFSDGVLAIVITIMVLELKIPHSAELADLAPLAGVFLSYVLSFAYIGIYWNNHHHLMYAARGVNARIMWANMHLLFWLSLLPFATGWAGENSFAPVPTALYGLVLLLAGVAYYVLQRLVVGMHGQNSALAEAFGADLKGKLSPALYLLGMGLAFVRPWIANAIYVLVALIWLMPDRRIERTLTA